MDALYAAHLGETATVQVHACEDPGKGKGVYALVHLDAGDVAMRDRPLSFLSSAELTAAAASNAHLPAPLHATCANCG